MLTKKQAIELKEALTLCKVSIKDKSVDTSAIDAAISVVIDFIVGRAGYKPSSEVLKDTIAVYTHGNAYAVLHREDKERIDSAVLQILNRMSV